MKKLTYEELEKENKRLKEELAENIFNNFFEKSAAIMLQVNVDTKKIEKINKAAIDFYGYSKEDFLKKTINDLIVLPSEEIDYLIKNAVTKNAIFFEFKHKLANGQIKYVEVFGSPVNINNKTYMIVIVHNIDEREKNKETINKLSMAVEQSANTIVITDTEGNIEYVNPKFTELTGYTKEEAIGQNPIILNAGVQSSQYYSTLWETIKSGRIWKGEFCNKAKGGRIFWEKVTITPIKDITGKIINFLAIKEDITKSKIYKQKIEEREKKYRLLFEDSPLAIYTALPDGTIVDINKKLLNLLGSPSIKATRQINVLKFKPLVDNGYADSFKKVCKTGIPLKIEMKYTSKWGKTIFLKSTIMPLKDKDDNIVQVYSIMEDISEQKRVENEKEKQNKKLVELNATKDKFFSIIAHDLISPFNALLGFSNLLVENFDEYDNEQKKEFANILYKGITSTYKLLDNLLLWSRNQRGKISFNPEKENLYLIYEETFKLLKQVAGKKEIIIKENIDRNTFVYADKNMLLTILRNLISNAIKFTPRKGTITVKSKQINNTFVEISVVDTGMGMNKETVKNLFKISDEPLIKGTEGETGTGLGLIITKEFIKKHKGDIFVESKEGQGSKFTFTLPLD